jgi:hypothetical protein
MEDFSARPLVNAQLEDLVWLEGPWSGRVNAEEVHEIWSVASAGAMMGMFRCIREGAVRFYEFMTITKGTEQTELTIKHFDAALAGWEERDKAARFILTELTEKRAVFHQSSGGNPLWLVYESTEGPGLRIYFRPIENSPVGDSEFVLHRKVRENGS